jgi:hypothetical protein
VIRLRLLTLPAEAAKTAAGASSPTFKNIDITSTGLRHEPRVSSVLLGQRPLSVRWRRRESREVPLIFVVGAYNYVEVSLLANREMLSLIVQ